MTEITAFWATLQDQHSAHADARKAQILTMASPRDVCGMRWEDIDLQQAVWSVHGKDHSIPLPKQMMDMLTNVQHLSGVSRYVFFDEPTGSPLPSEFLCFGAGDIREAFMGWLLAQSIDPTQEAGAIFDAWATYLKGNANV